MNVSQDFNSPACSVAPFFIGVGPTNKEAVETL